MMLKGHVYKTAMAGIGLECVLMCRTDDRCQSFNFVISRHLCEFNDRTKEARPKDFVADPDRYYYTKDINRVPLGSISDLAAESCKEIKASEPQVTSGKFWLSTIKRGVALQTYCDMKTFAFQSCNQLYGEKSTNNSLVVSLDLGNISTSVFCHMGNFGCGDGGWTTVMKIDGSKQTFRYNSTLWSNTESFNPAGGETGFDNQETKLPTYWKTPFDKICLGMKIGQHKRFIVINKQASSLYSLIADGKPRNISLGRDTWKSLIGANASLQKFCNKEGFNVMDSSTGSAKARIGIIADDVKNVCQNTDSRIGFGTGGRPNVFNTCGNAAGAWSPDNGEKNIKAIGYILVQ
ncbi:uncharacterized protein [Acropora muricata]|uniref:uncharacterized protein n=1 Tax=Acropora muricata TaxID=159855 RepID=UPI0034E5663C